jgi:UDP-N-acetylmuramate dehydrogenase
MWMDLPDVLVESLLAHEGQELGPLTTLGVGGPAPWVLEPRTRPELMLAVKELTLAGIPWRMLGHGSNLLVSDAGVPDVVLHTRSMKNIYHDGVREHAMRCEAGASLARLVSVGLEMKLGGAERLIGIPGTVGGAVAGNAGGSHGSMGDLLLEVTLITPDGEDEVVPCTPDMFGYRSSPFAGKVVLDAVVGLCPDSVENIRERMETVLREKTQAQPLAARSAGCMFKNPAAGSSGRLIDQAGCKGMAEGGASVSERHANFVLNDGRATARDVSRLLCRVADEVERAEGVRLQLEVEPWGEHVELP